MVGLPVCAKVDRTSEAYLKDAKHFSIMNPVAECIAEKEIKKSLKKETGAKFKVKFEGYTLSSMKKGIFKYLEITGDDVNVDGIDVPYVNFKSLSDYNWIDYNKDPIVAKSDMTFAYDLKLSENSINTALKDKKYQNTIKRVNKRAYPLFAINGVSAKVKNNRVYLIMTYHLPLISSTNVKTFMVSTDFKVENGKIYASNVGIDSAYGNLPLDKVTNLINLLDPLSFTLDLLDSNECHGKIENIKIVDDIIQVDGKIYVKGE
jgi:hypothetical protein